MGTPHLHISHPGASQMVVEARWQPPGLEVRFADGCRAVIAAEAFADFSPRPPTDVQFDAAGVYGLWLVFGDRREFFPWDWLRHYADPKFAGQTAANMARTKAHMGERVRAARAALGLSQHQLADLAGLSRATIARLEGGDGGVTLATLERLAVALGADFDGVFGAVPKFH